MEIYRKKEEEEGSQLNNTQANTIPQAHNTHHPTKKTPLTSKTDQHTITK